MGPLRALSCGRPNNITGIEGYEAIDRATVRPTVKTGQLFIPMHYVGTNTLTYPAVDPHSRQPSYEHCAMHIERAV